MKRHDPEKERARLQAKKEAKKAAKKVPRKTVLKEVPKGVTYHPDDIPSDMLRIAGEKMLEKLNKLVAKRKTSLVRPYERAILTYNMERIRATSYAQLEAANGVFRQALVNANITLTIYQ